MTSAPPPFPENLATIPRMIAFRASLLCHWTGWSRVRCLGRIRLEPHVLAGESC
jgi:hypothetical protein